jgi:hypothetical protein
MKVHEGGDDTGLDTVIGQNLGEMFSLHGLPPCPGAKGL